MNTGTNQVFSNGWVQNAGVALIAAAIASLLPLFVRGNRTQTIIYTLAFFLCVFIALVIVVGSSGARGGYLVGVVMAFAIFLAACYLANYFVPIISMHHKGRPSIEPMSTVPGAVPLYRVWAGDKTVEATVQLENIGRESLSNAKVRIEIPFGFNLTCFNHQFSVVAGDPLDGRWHNIIEVDLGNMYPKRPPTDLILHVEFQPGSWREDLELKATIYGEEYPGAGKPPVGEKLCIQRM